MKKKNPREKFQKYSAELSSISDDKGKKKQPICLKILKALQTKFDECVNYDILLHSISNIPNRALYCSILKEIIERQIIEDEEKKSKFKKLLLTDAFLLPIEDKDLKTECLKVATNYCKNIKMKNPYLLMEYLLFDCFLPEPNHDYLKLIVHFLENNIELPKLLIDFIIEIVIQFAIVNRGKLASNFKSIYHIFHHYMIKVKGARRFLKKMILGIICLESYLDPMREDNSSLQWYFLIDFIKENQIDTMDLLLDILKQYFTEQSYIQSLFNFKQFTNYLIFEELTENEQKRNKKIEQYQKRYEEYQRRLFEKENKKKELIRESVDIILSNKEIRNNILEGTLFIIKQLYLFKIEDYQFTFDYPLINFLDLLKLIGEEKIVEVQLIKIYIDILMSITLQYGDTILNNLYDILLLCTKKFNQCFYFELFKKDPKFAELGKEFTNKILSFVLRRFIPLNKFQFNEAISKSKRIVDRNHSIEDFIIKNPIVSESSIILKCLLLFENIENNINLLFKDYIVKLSFPVVNCYLFNVLKTNFLNSSRYSDLIEENVLKYQTICANSFYLQDEIQNTFIDLLTQVLLKTKKEKKFIDSLNDLLIVSEPNTLLDFQINTLLVLYYKLNKNYEYSKLQICNTIVFKKEMFMINSTLKILLPFFEKMIVNRECEVLFATPLNSPEEESPPSQMMLNIFDTKGTTNNNSQESNNPILAHYLLLNHSDIFDHMFKKADKLDLNKEDKILEGILKMFNNYTKQIFPLKAINMSQFIKIISKKEYYLNNKSNDTIFSYILSIVVNMCYHFNSNLLKTQMNTSPLDIKGNSYKIDFLELLTNTYCTLIDVIKLDITQNPKYGQNSQTTNKAFDTAMKTLNSSGNNNPNKNVSTQGSNKSQNSNRAHSNHNSSISSNSSNAKENNTQNQNAQDDYHLNPDIKMKLKQVTTIFSTFHFYLNSLTEYNLNSSHRPVSAFPSSFQNFEELSRKESGSVRLDTSIKQLLNKISETLWVFQFKLRYGIAIVTLLLGIKDFLFKMGDEVILKVIIIAMGIAWHQEDYGLVNTLETNFKINDYERLNKECIIDLSLMSKRKRLQYVYLQYLADTLTLYFIEKFTYSTRLLQSIHEMLNTIPEYSFRKYLFFEQCKWHLSMRTLRDNLNHCYRGLIAKDTQIFLGKNNIIMIVPISMTQTEIIIRNTIANINVSINATFENEDCAEALNLLKKDTESNALLPENDCNSNTNENNKPKKAINNSMIIFQQIINLTSESIDAFEYCTSDTIIKNLPILDAEPVYTVFHCGVMYAKTNCLIDEYQLLTYDDEVSKEYIAFLHSLGHLYNIASNPQINVGLMDSKGANGKLILCHQDSLFQIVFQVSNLITSSTDNTKEALYSIRKNIVLNNFVNIIWMDNPYKVFDENLINTDHLMVYLILHPISSTYYLVKKRYNKRSDLKICRNIKKVMINDFVININDPSSVMYLIQCIIQINMMHEYLLEFTKLEVGYGSDNTTEPKVLSEGFSTNYSRRHNVIVNINNKDNKVSNQQS